MVKNQLQRFFVGTYSEKGPYIPRVRGEGIVSCTLDPRSGQIQKTSLCQDIINATYLVKSPAGNILFAACDRYSFPGKVKAFAVNPEGTLTLLSTGNTYGTSTCHVTCDSKGMRVFVASYGDGKVTVYKFDGKAFSPASQIISYKGSGPNAERQEAAHPHQAIISPNGKWLYICDLGSDRIWVHDLSNTFGKLEVLEGIKVPAGYGVRHLICHPTLPFVYVFCELNSHVLIYNRNDQTGLMTLVADERALPPDYTGISSGSAIKIHPSMETLYVSNRGHNSLTVFSIEADGYLKLEDCFSSEGEDPRDFAIDPTGHWLLVANQNTDNIVSFKLDPVTGFPTGKNAAPFQCGTPVCIAFN